MTTSQAWLMNWLRDSKSKKQQPFIMKMINEQEVFETWAPLIESKTDIKDKGKIEWLTKYCNYHSLNETHDMGGYNTLNQLNGMEHRLHLRGPQPDQATSFRRSF